MQTKQSDLIKRLGKQTNCMAPQPPISGSIADPESLDRSFKKGVEYLASEPCGSGKHLKSTKRYKYHVSCKGAFR